MKLIYPWNQHEPKADTEYYFNVDENGKCTICFNGSERLWDSVKDWLYNLMFWRSLQIEIGYNFDFRKATEKKYLFTAHYGLYRKWQLLEKKLKYLMAMSSAIKSYEISGYSQGASTALFCHRWIKASGDTLPIKTVIAGCPKLFGLLGLKRNRELCKDVINLQYGNDIVTKIPPGSNHVGQIRHTGPERKWFKLSVKDHLLGENDYRARTAAE